MDDFTQALKGNPLQGTGLQSLAVLGKLGSLTPVPTADLIGLAVGGILGWMVSRKFPKMIVSYIGVIAGAELGIMAVRLIKGGSNV